MKRKKSNINSAILRLKFQKLSDEIQAPIEIKNRVFETLKKHFEIKKLKIT